ncbi:phage BR0599 family protein [Rhizobium ruizarguesonis]
MSFSSIETSRHRGQPVTLYHFAYSETAYFAYTDAENPITHDDNGSASGGEIIYEPIPIMREAVVSSGTMDKSALSIRMPRDVELGDLFRVYPPAQVVTLIIRQGHLSDTEDPPEFLVIWSGRVLSVARDGDECVVSCEPVSSSLRRPGLRRHYQFGCPHVLYGPQCSANKAAHSISTTVSALSGTSITLPGGWNGSFSAAKFVEGVVEWTNDAGGIERRKILKVTGNVLLLGGLLRDLDVGATITAALGCNHQMSDCQNLFANIQNFGGCPWIPTENPIGPRNNYY